MDVVASLSLGLGLAADAFAVSLSRGLAIQRLTLSKALVIALFFGSFQMAMLLLGWLLSATWRVYFATFDHWIAWALLTGIGLRAMQASFRPAGQKQSRGNPLETGVLVALAIATSLDALIAGLGLAALPGPVLAIAATVGVITFSLCVLGVVLGRHCAHLLTQRVEFLGGLLLVALGGKILYTGLQ